MFGSRFYRARFTTARYWNATGADAQPSPRTTARVAGRLRARAAGRTTARPNR